ncbi:arylsulfatase [Flammeovirga kamogawensis]|uniref:Arylsulfatase n=1 Tax=Flammeovirga kamogawensis TaxID=373891 RepID=A0ABX8GQX5_9BACT|nr:arylsulfatase [Flammeovirga kamogawensis]MBB6463050.1 arylsulfatase [Flammeovirga kamogawensis]QWG05687.1 arylsulfatase [Flammeovirga kamogawensis]TRX67515.1 arylsulfatase [Flammeovirga kamogawensis]
MKNLLITTAFWCISLLSFAQQKPNIVVIMTDDVAPQDISAYHRGLGAVSTPNIDQIADEGLLINDYYAQQSCTAGRSSFITGQYPIRTGLTSVGQPGSKIGLQAEDVTLAEMLKDQGYATAHFGKSHLGDRNEHLPTAHGFDEFYGFLYHLNMMEMPEQPEFPKDKDFVGRPRNVIYSKATTIDDPTIDPRWGRVGKITVEDKGELGALRQETFDDEVLEISQKWMKKKQKEDAPFFLWFNPSRMHQEIYVSEKWQGKSGHSTYADGLLHLDYLVGELLQTLEDIGEKENTIVLFTSDNGVNLAHWPSAGTASFRGEKGTTWDGGFRVPMLVMWPEHIPAGKWSGELMTSEDWVPTLMAAIGEPNIKEELLEGKKINNKEYKVHLDGYNQLDLITKNGKSNRREFFYFAENDLQAIRVDHWKIHLAIKDEWLKSAEKLPAGMIINLKLDPYERTPETPGHFLWMKEKTWILPTIVPPLKQFGKSMKEFPPRQKGTGIGAGAIMNQK